MAKAQMNVAEAREAAADFVMAACDQLPKPSDSNVEERMSYLFTDVATLARSIVALVDAADLAGGDVTTLGRPIGLDVEGAQTARRLARWIEDIATAAIEAL